MMSMVLKVMGAGRVLGPSCSLTVLRAISATVLAALVLAVAPGCISGRGGAVSVQDERDLNVKYAEKVMYLACSMYFTDFFRDDRYGLLTSDPPNALEQVYVGGGNHIRPSKTYGVIQAGGPVRIKKIEFPDATLYRSATTPHWFPWVYVEVVNPSQPVNPSTLVLVVEMTDVEGPEAFERALSRLLVPTDYREALYWLPEELGKAVIEKRLIKDMPAQQVEWAMCKPRSVDGYYVGSTRNELWRYSGALNYHFIDGRLEDAEPLPKNELARVQQAVISWQEKNRRTD